MGHCIEIVGPKNRLYQISSFLSRFPCVSPFPTTSSARVNEVLLAVATMKIHFHFQEKGLILQINSMNFIQNSLVGSLSGTYLLHSCDYGNILIGKIDLTCTPSFVPSSLAVHVCLWDLSHCARAMLFPLSTETQRSPSRAVLME